MDNLLTLPEVAELLSVAERTVYLWAQQGRIPAFKLGSSWRFNKSDIEYWLESQRNAAAGQSRLSRSRRFKIENDSEAEIRHSGLVEACKLFIERTIETSDRSAFLIETFYEDFEQSVVDEALKQVLKSGNLKIQKVEGLNGSKVDALVRKG